MGLVQQEKDKLKIIPSWQKCPVCDGTGLVSKPPWVAGDVSVWVDSQAGPHICHVCQGRGIIRSPQ